VHVPPLLYLLAVLAAGAGCSRPPDVIFITLDTTRADHLGALGYERPISPNLDRFAREAVTYRRAWATDSWTLPSHASMFTGQYPTRHGAHFNADGGVSALSDVLPGQQRETLKVNVLRQEAVTLAEMLRAGGYATAAIVGGPWLSPTFGLLQGYEFQDASVSSVAGRRSDELTAAAMAWVESVPKDKSLHLFVNYFDPHFPYDPPRGFDSLPGATRPLGVTPFGVLGGQPLSDADREAFIGRYDGEIGFMDHHFGRLISALRRAGRYDDALTVVVADHGETFGEHRLMEHGRWLYEEVIRVPLLVRYPHARNGNSTVDSPVSIVDLLPLVAEELGLPLPDDVDGVPLGERDVVLAESFRDSFMVNLFGARFDRDLVAVIRWPWKLIVSSQGDDELYRLDQDPRELDNRAEKERAQVRELRKAISEVRGKLEPPPAVSGPSVDSATKDALRALGYIE
jgi:arylsulfatase A-like enzyme